MENEPTEARAALERELRAVLAWEVEGTPLAQSQFKAAIWRELSRLRSTSRLDTAAA